MTFDIVIGAIGAGVLVALFHISKQLEAIAGILNRIEVRVKGLQGYSDD